MVLQVNYSIGNMNHISYNSKHFMVPENSENFEIF